MNPLNGKMETSGTSIVDDPNVFNTNLSGLAYQPSGSSAPGVLWAHADSGADAEIHALTETGDHLATYPLEGATATDWEDIAVGPGPEDDTSYVYVGDIGDNTSVRGDVTVYRVATPGGMRVEALLANSQSGRAKFFDVGDAVEMSWSVEAGHFIEE